MESGGISKLESEIITIVGCGDSAKDWQPRGYSIGLNDSWKWGKPTDALLLANGPTRFRSDRFEIIKNSTPKTFYSLNNSWEKYFPNWMPIRPNAGKLIPWYGTLRKGGIYESETSSFIALSLAYALGAKTIIMWGVDLLTHHIFNPSNPGAQREVERHLEIIRELNDQGVEVFLGANGSVFDSKLKVYAEK